MSALCRNSPTWRSSPSAGRQVFRRCAQALCLALFLLLFGYVCWPYTAVPAPERSILLDDGRRVPAHYAMDLVRKEALPAEVFLWLDPLSSVSAAVAARLWTRALWWATAVLLLGVVVPRWFCSYACPLGTIIGTTDWLLRAYSRKLRLRARGWGSLRFVMLVLVLTAAAWGVLLAGFVAPLPVLTRGLACALTPLQLGLSRGWHNVAPLSPGMAIGAALLGLTLLLGLLAPRFWCRYVCPSGALLSLAGLAGRRERRLGASCTACGKCLKACPFDAINEDFTTVAASCAFCRTCEAVCPAGAVSFAWRTVPRAAPGVGHGPPVLTRRGFLAASALGSGAALGTRHTFAAGTRVAPLRPPGSLPERDFLAACSRCSQCIRACPNSVLQPLGLEQGIEGFWTPVAVPDWSGCDPSCNNCGQVCPTGAIRALPLLEKRGARMGLAVIDRGACLPWAGTDACEMCADECRAAGYDAIEFERVGVVVDEDGSPAEGSGRRAPVVTPERCVGCGLCQTRCQRINVVAKRTLRASAIRVLGGPSREDRMRAGSYVGRREQERQQRLRDSRALEQRLRG